MTDPASQHPYMYCRGNPIRYSDPSGYSAGVLVKKGGEGLLILSPAGGPTAPVIAGGAVVLIGTGYLIDIYTTPEGIETLRFAGEQIKVEISNIKRFIHRFAKGRGRGGKKQTRHWPSRLTKMGKGPDNTDRDELERFRKEKKISWDEYKKARKTIDYRKSNK